MKFTSIDEATQIGDNQLIASASQWVKSSCEFRGSANSLILDADAKCTDATVIFFGDNSTVHVASTGRLNGKISLGHGCKITVGARTTITARLELSTAEQTSIKIGADCMFGLDCRVITHDFHPIFDANTGKRINLSKSIEIGDHVWIADGAIIRKGVTIGSGSVIGERSLVLHDVPENCVVVGSPAKVVRTGIRWERDSLRTLAAPMETNPRMP